MILNILPATNMAETEENFNRHLLNYLAGGDVARRFVEPVEGLVQCGNCPAFIRDGEGSV